METRTSGYKSPKSRSKRGAEHHNWKGGAYKHSDGYIYEYAPNHRDSAKGKGYVLQHRLVMERVLGRPLVIGEIVHHKNEIKDDNRPENLSLTSRSPHAAGHKAAAKRDLRGRFA